MAEGELLSAKEAMELLGVSETELQSMVARGDLRAFRSAGTMKFRRDDVKTLKSEKETQPTIILPPSAPKKPGQSDRQRAATVRPPPAPRAQEPNATDHIVLDNIDDMVLLPAAEDGLGTQQATVVSAQGVESPTVAEPATTGHTGQQTVVDLGTEAPAPPRPTSTSPSASGRRAAAGSRVGGAISRIRQPGVVSARRTAAVFQPKSGNPIWTGVLVVNAAVMLFGLGVVAMCLKPHVYEAAPGQAVQRAIPPFMSDFYTSFKKGGTFVTLPGDPQVESEASPAAKSEAAPKTETGTPPTDTGAAPKP